jgi:hypothetical protein
MSTKVVIARLQNRRGRRENLPQPLRPGELALTSDTRQVWIGGDPAFMPAGVLLYNPADIATAQNIVDTIILEVRFNDSFGETQFDIVKNALVNSPAFSLEEEDVLWDTTLRTNPPNSFDGYSIYIAADQGLNVNHTLANIETVILGTSAAALHISTDYVGDLAPFGGDFDVDGFLNLDTAGQSTIIATLLNRVHGSSSGIATTNLNIEIGTGSGGGAVVSQSTTKAATWVSTDGNPLSTPTNDVYAYFPQESTIQSVVVLTEGGPGDCQIDVRAASLASYPPVGGDSIAGASKPSITAGVTYQDSTLTGWTTTIPANSVVAFSLESVATFTMISIYLEVL